MGVYFLHTLPPPPLFKYNFPQKFLMENHNEIYISSSIFYFLSSPDIWISSHFFFLIFFLSSHTFLLFFLSSLLRSNISIISESLHELYVSSYLADPSLVSGLSRETGALLTVLVSELSKETGSSLPEICSTLLSLSSSYKGFNSVLFSGLKISRS